MKFEYSNFRSNDLSIDILVDYTKKLYNCDKTKVLDNADDECQKLSTLHKILFGKSIDVDMQDDKICYLVEKIKDKLSDVAAKRYIEEGIKKEVIKKMQTREKEYLEEMKLQVIKKHTGLENASTLKKYAKLEKLKTIKLSKSVLDILRPESEKEIIGQQDAIEALISKLATPFPQHVILYGPPGVGKTTAARIALSIAKKRRYTPFKKNAKFVEVDATTLRWDPRESVNPLIGSVHDPIYQGASKALAESGIPEPKPGLVTEAHGGVLFIDEIGELDTMFQNKLLKVLEDKQVNFDSSYYDVNNDNIPMYIKQLFKEGAPADFVLIGATTRTPDEINPALRSRCTEVFFNPLDSSHIVQIVINAADKIDVKINKSEAVFISNYTYEARRAISILADCYSCAMEKIVDSEDNIVISEEIVKEVLSRSRLIPINKTKSSSGKEIGKINGVGVNGFLGNIIEFEAIAFDNQDETGKVRFNETVGSMTKDSIFNAISVVRILTKKNMDKYDIHVNCIGGGKVDGPSAGVAITSLIYSAITNKKARLDTCITGEVAIRGSVKPVGGVIEKVNAAKRYGFDNIIIPLENAREVQNIEGINIVPVGNIQEVIEFIFQ